MRHMRCPVRQFKCVSNAGVCVQCISDASVSYECRSRLVRRSVLTRMRPATASHAVFVACNVIVCPAFAPMRACVSRVCPPRLQS